MSSFTYKPIKQTLREEIKYVTRGGTAKYLFTKNLMDGCEGEKGLDYASQCMAIERIYEKVPKKGETRCYDFILAPDPADRLDPEKVLRFAGDVASEYFRDYQVVAAVHTDTESPHAHIMVNAVNLLTGNKLNMSDVVYFQMRQWVDELGERRYGFSKWDANRNSDNSYNKAEKEQIKKNDMTGPRWELRRSVLKNKEKAVTEDDFFRLMKFDGVDVESSKDGRDYVYRMPAYINRQSGKPLGIRGSTLGRLYTKDCVLGAIAKRTTRPEKSPGDLSGEGAANPAETLFVGVAEELSENTYHVDDEGANKAAEREAFSGARAELAMPESQAYETPEEDTYYAWWEFDSLPEDVSHEDDEGAYEGAEGELFSDAYGEPAMTDGQIRAASEEDARYARWEADNPTGEAYRDDEDASGDTEERILSGMLCDFAVPDAPARDAAADKTCPDGEKEALPQEKYRTDDEITRGGTPGRKSFDASAETYMQDTDISADRLEGISLKSGEHADREISEPRAEIATDEGHRAEDGESREDVLPRKRVSPGDGAYREGDDFSDDVYPEEKEGATGNILSGVKRFVSKGLERAKGLAKRLLAKDEKEAPRGEKKQPPGRVSVRGRTAPATVAAEKSSPAENAATGKPASGTRDAFVREENAPALCDVPADARALDEIAAKADAEREKKEVLEKARAVTVRFSPDRPLWSIREFNYYDILDIWADYAWHELACGNSIMYHVDYMNAVDAILKECGGSVQKVRERIRFNPPEEYIPLGSAAQKEERDEILIRLHDGMDIHAYMDCVTRPICAERDSQARRKKAEEQQERSQNYKYKDGK